MSKQPEALRLAEILFGMTAAFPTPSNERGGLNDAAAELRRQHAEIERLQAERDALLELLKDVDAAIYIDDAGRHRLTRSFDVCRISNAISTATGAAA